MGNAKNRRVQTAKGRQTKVVKSGSNPEYVAGMQGIRRSNASGPHKLKTAYTRKTRNNNKLGEF